MCLPFLAQNASVTPRRRGGSSIRSVRQAGGRVPAKGRNRPRARSEWGDSKGTGRPDRWVRVVSAHGKIRRALRSVQRESPQASGALPPEVRHLLMVTSTGLLRLRLISVPTGISTCSPLFLAATAVPAAALTTAPMRAPFPLLPKSSPRSAPPAVAPPIVAASLPVPCAGRRVRAAGGGGRLVDSTRPDGRHPTELGPPRRAVVVATGVR